MHFRWNSAGSFERANKRLGVEEDGRQLVLMLTTEGLDRLEAAIERCVQGSLMRFLIEQLFVPTWWRESACVAGIAALYRLLAHARAKMRDTATMLYEKPPETGDGVARIVA